VNLLPSLCLCVTIFGPLQITQICVHSCRLYQECRSGGNLLSKEQEQEQSERSPLITKAPPQTWSFLYRLAHGRYAFLENRAGLNSEQARPW
jgi:hypothetical protein